MSTSFESAKRPAVKVFVATTVLLSFISFWRAAAIVLSDLGSSAYYVGGDAEKVIGKSAPWFILAVMLFANCVRALYIESTSMFVRGGVYRVVRRAMGGTLAKFSVSALLFDYVLTGPLSSVVAGQYLAGFIQDIFHYSGHALKHFPDNAFSASVGILVTVYFWWKNTQGIQGSPSHGIGITPDGKVLWATSKWYHYVAAYSMPDLKLLGVVSVGHEPDWLTFTPDSKMVYVACAGSNYVSAVDVNGRKEITRIAVGQVPKRNITAVLQ